MDADNAFKSSRDTFSYIQWMVTCRIYETMILNDASNTNMTVPK